jgi:antitoxin component of MazEF toxin-antitoxin module
MVLRIQRIGDGLGVMIPPDVVEDLDLREGATLTLAAEENGEAAALKSKYVTAEEAVASYLRTEPLHADTYRELAK